MAAKELDRSSASLFAACLAFGLVLVLASGITGCGKEPPPKTPAVRPVKTLTVGAVGGAFNREWPGRVEPSQNAELAFEVAGRLIELPVQEGKEVEQGVLLARLDPRDYRARLDAANAKLRQTKAEYARSEDLVKQAVAPASELDQRRKLMDVAQADVDQARKAVEETKIRAPFTGTVAKIHADNFQNVQAKQAIMLLQDKSSLEIVTHVPERDMAMAKPGLTIEERNERISPKVQFDSIPDRTFECALKEVATVADPVTQTYEVTWSIDPPPDANILPGMTAKLILDDVQVDETEVAVHIPANAVVGADEGGAHVWQIDPGSMQVSRLDVEVGEVQGSSIEIKGGLEGGELIAVSGVHELRDGMQVSRFEDLYGATERAQ